MSLVEKAVKQFGKIDVMINNAGIGGESKKIDELTEKDWDEVIDINLKGAFLCTREAVKNMVSRLGNEQNADNNKNNNYSIINISSVHQQTSSTPVSSLCSFKGRHGNAN